MTAYWSRPTRCCDLPVFRFIFQATEDNIIVYNSCDILKKDEYPMDKTGLKYDHTEFFPDAFTEFYNTISWNMSNVTGILNFGGRKFETHKVEKSKPGRVSIFFDSKTGKALEVQVDGSLCFLIFDDAFGYRLDTNASISDHAKYVKGGDGIHEMEGRI